MIDTKRLRQKILDLAIRGKLVPQDPADEPASVLLERIHQEKLQMVADGKLKKKDIVNDSVIYLGDDSLHYEKVGDNEPVCVEEELPFELPEGWCWVRAICVMSKIGAGSTPRGGSKVYKTEGVKFIRSQNVYDDGLRLSGVAFIDCDTNITKAGSIVHPNDLLLNITGGSIGRCALVSPDFDEANVNQHVMILRLVGDNLQGFIHAYITSPLVQKAILKRQLGSGRGGLSAETFSTFLIPIPPLAEQQRIVTTLDDLLARVDTIEREQAELDELLAKSRSKVLDLAIRGKLVPQDPADEPASVLLERIHAEKLQMVADGKLKKKDVAGDSVIYRGDDNSYYERRDSGQDALLESKLYPLPASWRWTRLGTISNYGDSSSVPSSEISDDDWILDLEDIEKDTGAVIRRITKTERNSASAKRPFSSGQLLYSKLRPYLNKVLIAPDDGYCTSEILPIQLYGGCDPYFVMAYFRSPFFLRYANHCSYGVKMPRLGTNDGRKAFIALPPVAEQRKISHAVDAIQSCLTLTK